jgi:crotonobetainyl-CoA:carnitine CoA-transferase CaiB-like acyl-CoA transferase
VTGPLDGIRIVDLSTVLSGPLATALCADQGATVVKVEPPGAPDLTRQVGSRRAGLTAMYLLANRGKRSLVLDLRRPAGVEVLHRLVAGADVLVQNFRPGVVERLGIDPDALAAVNPRLVYVSIAGFGFEGPLAGLRVYDNLIQAASGMTAVQGGDGDPAFVKQLAVDKLTALAAAQAITAALLARERGLGGRAGDPSADGGQHIRIAMLDTAISFLWPDAGTPHTLLGEGVAVSPAGGAYELTRFADGFGTAVPVSDAEFRAYCRAFGVEHVADDPRFATLARRLTDPDWPAVWRDVVQAAAARVPVADALARLTAADVPNVAAVPLAEVPATPQVVTNGTFVEVEHPVAGPMRQPAPAARFGATPAAPAGPAPTYGQHTDEVLAELGYDGAAIAALRDDGVVA